MKCYEKRHCSSVGRSISRAASPAVSRSVRQSFQTGPVQSSPVQSVSLNGSSRGLLGDVLFCVLRFVLSVPACTSGIDVLVFLVIQY